MLNAVVLLCFKEILKTFMCVIIAPPEAYLRTFQQKTTDFYQLIKYNPMLSDFVLISKLNSLVRRTFSASSNTGNDWWPRFWLSRKNITTFENQEGNLQLKIGGKSEKTTLYFLCISIIKSYTIHYYNKFSFWCFL